jgi:hypothetical protein
VAVLELAPWGGDSLKRSNPDGEVRTHHFGHDGEGLAIYLVLDPDLSRS